MAEFKIIKISPKAHEALQLLSDKRKREHSYIRSQFDIASDLIIKAAKKELEK